MSSINTTKLLENILTFFNIKQKSERHIIFFIDVENLKSNGLNKFNLKERVEEIKKYLKGQMRPNQIDKIIKSYLSKICIVLLYKMPTSLTGGVKMLYDLGPDIYKNIKYYFLKDGNLTLIYKNGMNGPNIKIKQTTEEGLDAEPTILYEKPEDGQLGYSEILTDQQIRNFKHIADTKDKTAYLHTIANQTDDILAILLIFRLRDQQMSKNYINIIPILITGDKLKKAEFENAKTDFLYFNETNTEAHLKFFKTDIIEIENVTFTGRRPSEINVNYTHISLSIESGELSTAIDNIDDIRLYLYNHNLLGDDTNAFEKRLVSSLKMEQKINELDILAKTIPGLEKYSSSYFISSFNFSLTGKTIEFKPGIEATITTIEILLKDENKRLDSNKQAKEELIVLKEKSDMKLKKLQKTPGKETQKQRELIFSLENTQTEIDKVEEAIVENQENIKRYSEQKRLENERLLVSSKTPAEDETAIVESEGLTGTGLDIEDYLMRKQILDQNYRLIPTPRDGDCLLHSIIALVFRTPGLYYHIRMMIRQEFNVDYMRQNIITNPAYNGNLNIEMINHHIREWYQSNSGKTDEQLPPIDQMTRIYHAAMRDRIQLGGLASSVWGGILEMHRIMNFLTRICGMNVTLNVYLEDLTPYRIGQLSDRFQTLEFNLHYTGVHYEALESTVLPQNLVAGAGGLCLFQYSQHMGGGRIYINPLVAQHVFVPHPGYGYQDPSVTALPHLPPGTAALPVLPAPLPVLPALPAPPGTAPPGTAPPGTVPRSDGSKYFKYLKYKKKYLNLLKNYNNIIN